MDLVAAPSIQVEVIVEYKDFTDVPLHTCIERDLKRVNSVGESVIRGMYMQFLHKYPEPQRVYDDQPAAIIVDLDGTLALHVNRGPYDFDKCDTDAVNPVILELIKRFAVDHEILYVSGRDDSCKEKTQNWLRQYDLNPLHLLMRKTGDKRKDAVIKEEIYREQIQDKFAVQFVLDDRTQVIHMWRSLGLPTFQVNDGYF